MSIKTETTSAPPPSSQSHFAKFEGFDPDDDAPFEDEFSRLASSQDWIPGSQQFVQERTIALREELTLHYFSHAHAKLEDICEAEDVSGAEDVFAQKLEKGLTQEEIDMTGYQSLCKDVGIPVGDSIENCQRRLKATLVNIPDLINVRRTGQKVKIWDDFEEFRSYTLGDPTKMIHKEEAKAGRGYLASLLQRLIIRGSRLSRLQRRRRRKGGMFGGKVQSGRVEKSFAVHTKPVAGGCKLGPIVIDPTID